MQTELPKSSPTDPGNRLAARALPPVQRGIVLGMWMGLLWFGLMGLYPVSIMDSGYWYLVFLGAWIAQACLPAALATLAQQPWSLCLPGALGWTTILMVATGWANSRSTNPAVTTFVLGVPVIFLITLAPLTLLHWFFRWRIVVPEEPRPADPRAAQFSLRQLLLWMGATAVLLAWAKCVLPDGKTLQEEWDGARIGGTLLIGAIVGGIHLPILIPSVGLVLARTNRIRFALSALVGISLSILVLVGFLSRHGPIRWRESIVIFAWFESGFLGVFVGTLLILRFCGYRLLRRKEERRASASLTPTPAVERPRIWKTPFPYLVTAILLIGLALSWPAWKLERSRREIALARVWNALGVHATSNAGEISTLSFQEDPTSVEGLEKLQELRSAPAFETLYMGKLTDDQVHYLRGLATLKGLDLGHSRVTDAGLAQLEGLDRLQTLSLESTQITDEGLKYLQRFPNLEDVSVLDTRITDAGLAQLAGLCKLQRLDLGGTTITDAGLVHLRSLERLEDLSLNGTKIGDAGLVHLTNLQRLRELRLIDTQITDAGLKHLQSLKKLRFLDALNTQLTDRGIAEFKRALPACEVAPVRISP